jgi:hypothetical protein
MFVWLWVLCMQKMLEPLKHVLQAERIILASASPRRKEVLKNIVSLFFMDQVKPHYNKAFCYISIQVKNFDITFFLYSLDFSVSL